MAEIWRHIFAPEAYADVVNAVMLHPERAVSMSSLWSSGSTETSEPSGNRVGSAEGGFKGRKRGAEGAPAMQEVDLEMEEVIRPRLEPTSKRRAVEVRSPVAEPPRKMERASSVSLGTVTPKSVNFSEVTDTIGVSDTLSKQFREDALLKRKDLGKVKAKKEEVSVEIIPTETSAKAMSWDEFIAGQPEPVQKMDEAAVVEDKLRTESESFFECKPQEGETPSPSPAGEYSLTDLSSEIKANLAKYTEPSLVGVHEVERSRLGPIKFEKHERRPSLMAVPDVIKLNLPPLDASFSEVAIVVPTETDELVEISVPVEEVKEAVRRGEGARVSVQMGMGMDDAKVETQIEVVPEVSSGAQGAGIEIDIPFQNAFEALQEQTPAKAEPVTTQLKRRKQTKRAKKRERALRPSRGKPLLGEQPKVKVSEVERPDGEQSVIVVEPAAEVKSRKSVVEVKVVPEAVGAGGESPHVLVKPPKATQEWTAVGGAKVVDLERPEARKLEILLPTENVFEPLEGEQKEALTLLPTPIAPRGQPHRAEAEHKEEQLRRSIVASPASPLKIHAGEQEIVLKGIPSAAEPNNQKLKRELVNQMERLASDLDSKNVALSQQLNKVSDQLARLQELVGESRKTTVELTPPSQPTEPSFSSLYTERIGLCNPPSVNLDYFEPSLFATPVPKRVEKRHPSIDLTYFEPSLFVTPEKVKEAAVEEKPSLLSKITRGIEKLVKAPREEKHVTIPSTEPQAGKKERVVSEGMRHPSVDLQYFEPSLFTTPIAKPIPVVHPSIDLTYFEPSLFATPTPIKKHGIVKSGVEAIEDKPVPHAPPTVAHRKIKSGKVHPSVDLQYFEPSLFATPIAKPIPVVHPSIDLIHFEPSLFATPTSTEKQGIVRSRVGAIENKPVLHAPPPPVAHRKIKSGKVHPSVDLQYFEPSLFDLPEPAAKKKKKRSWIRRLINKLFKRKKKAKPSGIVQKEPARTAPSPGTKTKTHASVDLTYFEPSLFATPKPSPRRTTPSKPEAGVAPIAMPLPPQQPYSHFAKPVMMMQQPLRTQPTHEYNVQRLRQPSVDLQYFEPDLFREPAEFKTPLDKEKSPLLAEVQEITPQQDSLWTTLFSGVDTPELRQQAREMILAGTGIPEDVRPSLWLTLSGGAPTHTVCYRRLSRQAEPIRDNLYAMTQRLCTALDSYYGTLSGRPFEYSLESFVIQLITRTVQLPGSGAPLDSAILYQEEQTFALALNLLYGPKYRLAAVFTKHGLREWCYELDRILEHEDNIVHPPSLTFAAPWFQSLFFNTVDDDKSGPILDWFILEGRCVLFRLAVAQRSNGEDLLGIASDLTHITNTQLGHLHDSFESGWEQTRLHIHQEHKERSEVDHELVVLNSLSDLDKEIQQLYHSHHQLRDKLGHERDQRVMLEHANENLIFKLHDKNRPHL